MKMLRFLVPLVVTGWCVAAEPDLNLEPSMIGGKEIVSMPSPDFLKRGTIFRAGDKFEYDFRKAHDMAFEYLRKESKMMDLRFSRVSVVKYGDLDGDLWYAVLVFVGQNKDVARVIVNGAYEVWPMGKSHDPFSD